MSGISRLPALPSIQDLIRIYKLSARKQLSQNFLLDMNLTNKIVRAAGKLDDGFVCEVGPGPGGITRSLLNSKAKTVAVIEKDRRMLPSLQVLSRSAAGRLIVYHGDVLDFDIEGIIPDGFAEPWDSHRPNVHLIGNLPFSVSTPLIIKWLSAISSRSGPWRFGRTKLTLTFQKEVAERMVADIAGKQRSRLSVMCQYLCHVSLKFTIPGCAFVPPPDVDVAVVTMVPRKEAIINLPFPLVEKVVRHVFHYRQKYIRHGVETLFPVHRPELGEEMIENAGLSPTLRSFLLSIEEFGQLCQVYSDICEREGNIIDYEYRSKQNISILRHKVDVQTEYIESQILLGCDSVS